MQPEHDVNWGVVELVWMRGDGRQQLRSDGQDGCQELAVSGLPQGGCKHAHNQMLGFSHLQLGHGG